MLTFDMLWPFSAWIKVEQLKPYHPHKEEMIKINKGKRFQQAVDAVEEYLKKAKGKDQVSMFTNLWSCFHLGFSVIWSQVVSWDVLWLVLNCILNASSPYFVTLYMYKITLRYADYEQVWFLSFFDVTHMLWYNTAKFKLLVLVFLLTRRPTMIMN